MVSEICNCTEETSACLALGMLRKTCSVLPICAPYGIPDRSVETKLGFGFPRAVGRRTKVSLRGERRPNRIMRPGTWSLHLSASSLRSGAITELMSGGPTALVIGSRFHFRGEDVATKGARACVCDFHAWWCTQGGLWRRDLTHKRTRPVHPARVITPEVRSGLLRPPGRCCCCGAGKAARRSGGAGPPPDPAAESAGAGARQPAE